MGWSCRKEAGDEDRRWTEACRADTGTANVYRHGAALYIIQTSNREHSDGAITGIVIRMEREDGEPELNPLAPTCRGRTVGRFRINGDGTVARWPIGFKAVLARRVVHTASVQS